LNTNKQVLRQNLFEYGMEKVKVKRKYTSQNTSLEKKIEYKNEIRSNDISKDATDDKL
jgi:hypothetical protein